MTWWGFVALLYSNGWISPSNSHSEWSSLDLGRTELQDRQSFHFRTPTEPGSALKLLLFFTPTAFFKSNCVTKQLQAGSSQKVWQFYFMFLQDSYLHWATFYIRNGLNSWKIPATYIAYKIFWSVHMRVEGDFVLSEQPHSRPAPTKQYCKNCIFRGIGTQAGIERSPASENTANPSGTGSGWSCL